MNKSIFEGEHPSIQQNENRLHKLGFKKSENRKNLESGISELYTQGYQMKHLGGGVIGVHSVV